MTKDRTQRLALGWPAVTWQNLSFYSSLELIGLEEETEHSAWRKIPEGPVPERYVEKPEF